MRTTYPQTSDPVTIAAQRGASTARSIAGVAVLCGILAVVVLAVRDFQPADAPRAGTSVAGQAGTTEPHSTASAASPVSSETHDEQPRLDPKEIINYQLNVHG